jgi:hypothetical protein
MRYLVCSIERINILSIQHILTYANSNTMKYCPYEQLNIKAMYTCQIYLLLMFWVLKYLTKHNEK